MCQGSLCSSQRLPSRNCFLPKTCWLQVHTGQLEGSQSRLLSPNWNLLCLGKKTTVFRSSPGWPGTGNGIQASLQLLDNPLDCLSGEKKNSSLWINKPTLILDSKNWNFVLTHNTESFGGGEGGVGAVFHCVYYAMRLFPSSFAFGSSGLWGKKINNFKCEPK